MSCPHIRTRPTDDRDYRFCMDCMCEFFAGVVPKGLGKVVCEEHGNDYVYWPYGNPSKKMSLTWARCQKCSEGVKV